ncbi:MAG: carboxypeptidase-like regulatory domain-containing protein [Bacteroidaceae bacterium]
MKISAIVPKGLFLLCLVPCLVYGQSIVSGVVLDSRNGEPMPYATVYVNGTTKGTITDNDGHFQLNSVQFPSTLVFSFVGYKALVLELKSDPDPLQIRLQTNDGLPEVVITDYSEREKYMEYFKSMFLGNDRWGQSATILNEDAIMFESSGTDETGSLFKAWAGEPIIIDQPVLGYELYVDLANFSVQRIGGNAICDILGYFFYKPYSTDKERKNAKYERNRASAFYNSNMHFLRSFYQNRLAENGYILSMTDTAEVVIDDVTRLPIGIGLYHGKTTDGQMQIYGLSDKRLKIRYYHKWDGSPLDLTKHKPGIHLFSESGIHLLKDTCTIFPGGTVPDNSIRFTGDISEKRIGASLPEDYQKFVTSRSETEYPPK